MRKTFIIPGIDATNELIINLKLGNLLTTLNGRNALSVRSERRAVKFELTLTDGNNANIETIITKQSNIFHAL